MRRAVLACVVALVLAAGCGDDGNGDGEDAATTTTTTTTASTSTTSTTVAAEPTDELPDSDESGLSELEDGRYFGFWDSLVIGDESAVGELDLAFFLTGAEAEAAAAERGDFVENDSYIVNDNPRLRTIIAKGDTEVLVLAGEGGSPDLEPSNVADFAVDRHERSGFWVTIEGGIATKIEEQFVP